MSEMIDRTDWLAGLRVGDVVEIVHPLKGRARVTVGKATKTKIVAGGIELRRKNGAVSTAPHLVTQIHIRPIVSR